MSHPRHEFIRQQYHFACGYCGVSEPDAGGELTTDHFKPQAAGGKDEVDNLVYACVKCNQFKHDFWPDADDLAHGRRILHPLHDDWLVHLTEDEQTGYLEALTETGRFHIALLRLNRPQLVEHRLSRRLQNVLQEKQRLLQQQNEELKKTIAAQEHYIALLKEQME